MQTGDTPLSLSAAKGIPGICKALIKLGAKLDHRSRNGYTPLMHAAATGNAETVALLLQSGAELKVSNAVRGEALGRRNEVRLDSPLVDRRVRRQSSLQLWPAAVTSCAPSWTQEQRSMCALL